MIQFTFLLILFPVAIILLICTFVFCYHFRSVRSDEEIVEQTHYLNNIEPEVESKMPDIQMADDLPEMEKMEDLNDAEIWKIANNTGVPPSLMKRDSASHLVQLHKKYHGGPPFSRKLYSYPMGEI